MFEGPIFANTAAGARHKHEHAISIWYTDAPRIGYCRKHRLLLCHMQANWMRWIEVGCCGTTLLEWRKRRNEQERGFPRAMSKQREEIVTESTATGHVHVRLSTVNTDQF